MKIFPKKGLMGAFFVASKINQKADQTQKFLWSGTSYHFLIIQEVEIDAGFKLLEGLNGSVTF